MTPKAIALMVTTIFIICISLVIYKIIFSDQESKYDQLMKKEIVDITPEEWTYLNKLHIKQYQKQGLGVDTMSYNEALQANLDYKEEFSPCSESNIINAFHEIMAFNMPNDRYENIETMYFEDCVYHINVYTTNKHSYNWKTFWVFKVYWDSDSERYILENIRKEFLG